MQFHVRLCLCIFNCCTAGEDAIKDVTSQLKLIEDLVAQALKHVHALDRYKELTVDQCEEAVQMAQTTVESMEAVSIQCNKSKFKRATSSGCKAKSE